MVSIKSSSQSKRTLRIDSANCRMVELEEFCKLLLGFNRLERADDPSTGLRGLRDEQTGITYLIERHKLAKHGM